MEKLQNDHCFIEFKCIIEIPTNGKKSAKLSERLIKIIKIIYYLYFTLVRENIYQGCKKIFKQQIIFNVLNLWKCILCLPKRLLAEFMLNFTSY